MKKKIIMYQVNSSNIELIGYDEFSQTLYVKFLTGDVYEYYFVEETLFTAMKLADSKGSFLHYWVKINSDNYPYQQVSKLDYTISTIPLPNPGSPHPNGYMTGFSKANDEIVMIINIR